MLAVCWAPCCSPQSPAFPPPPPPPVFPPALFGGFAGTAPMFDSSPACMHGLRFWLPVPIRRLVSSGCRRGLSVLAHAVSRRAHGSWTTPGLLRTRVYVPRSVALPIGAHGRHPKCLFEAQFPARQCLCLRFTRHIAAPSARLERSESVKANVFRAVAVPPTALNSYLKQRKNNLRYANSCTRPDPGEVDRECPRSPGHRCVPSPAGHSPRCGEESAYDLAQNAKRDVDPTRRDLFLFNHFAADPS